MNYVRKVTNSDVLKNIIDIPEGLKHKQVEIIILPYEENKNVVGSKRNNARGILGQI